MKGRGAGFNPPNRFESLRLEPLEIDLENDEDGRPVRTSFYKDSSRTVLSTNDSPDIPFTYSLNPYKGCEHGCIYCYARPTHEYWGFSAGLDFETKILVKHDAPELLAETFRKKNWKPQLVALSGNTDCYQPVERALLLTRRCLEVFLRYRNPVGILTKNALICRDLDVLRELALLSLVMVTVSVTTLDDELARSMEPRTAAPYRRLETIETLSKNGIPVTVLVAPVIPGLNDEEIPAILQAISARGAIGAGFTMLRLPGPVEPLFLEWLRRTLPKREAKIVNRIRDVRSGMLSDARFGRRMKGEGPVAHAIDRLFKLNCNRFGLNRREVDLATHCFRRDPDGQLELF